MNTDKHVYRCVLFSFSGTTTTEQHIFPGAAGGAVTNDLIQSIVNSVLQAHVAGRGSK